MFYNPESIHWSTISSLLTEFSTSVGHVCRHLFLCQHVVKPSLGRHLFHKVLGESGQREHSVPQGLLGDLAEEEGLVFKVVGTLV